MIEVAGPAQSLLRGGVAVGEGRAEAAASERCRAEASGPFAIVLPGSSTAVRVSVAPRSIRAGSVKLPPRFTTTTVKGVQMRVLTLVAENEVVHISRSLLEVNRNLAHLRWLLTLISLGGIGAAAILGALVSGRQ